jgi:UDP-glucose 4-epimerase
MIERRSIMENVLLVGGAGFIGSHLADKLAQNNYNIIVADNLLLGKVENIQHLIHSNKITFINADFSDFNSAKQLFENQKIDIVFHLAANSDIKASEKNPKIDFDNTFLTTYNILECMRIFGVKKLFFASTSAIYGDKEGVGVNEDVGPLFPISYYGGAKLASEAFISSYSLMNDIKCWIFRFPNVVGERSTHGVIYDFINRLKVNPKELTILGDGKQSKPYLYVKDLVDAIFYIWSHSSDRLNYYNIGVDSQTNVNTIADIVCEEMGLENVNKVFTGGSGGWKGDVPKFKYDLSKIHALGWKAKHTSDDAVRISARRILDK